MAATITDQASHLTKPVNVVFQQTLLRTARARCPYFVGSTPGSLSQHRGTFTISWRRIENLTPTTTALGEITGTLTLPTGRDAITPSITEPSATVAKYGQYIILNEEVDLVNFNGQTDDLVKKLSISAGRSLNMLQRNELEDNSTLVYANQAASGPAVASKLLKPDIAAVVNTLQNQVADTFTPMSTGSQNIGTQPILPAFWGLCHVDVAYDIANMTGFKSVETYAGQVQTANGEFGMVMFNGDAVRFVQSTDASVDSGMGGDGARSNGLRGTSDETDLYTTVIFGMDYHGSVGFSTRHVKDIYKAGDELPAIMMIQHEKGSAGVGDPFNEIATIAWKSWHAAKILNANWGRAIVSGATDLGN